MKRPILFLNLREYEKKFKLEQKNTYIKFFEKIFLGESPFPELDTIYLLFKPCETFVF